MRILERDVTCREPASWPGEPDGRAAEPSLTEVEVAVLGPVEIRGAARAFTRANAAELVVYLAVHRRGAANDVWATALWPDQLMAGPTLHSTASAARRSLGRSRAGHDHLPRSRGRLALAPTVGTDWRRLVALGGRDDPADWWRGLDAVRGRPFDGLRNVDWAVLEGIAAAVEDDVVRLASRVAEHHLARGEGAPAARAARVGLLASPFDERLYRLILRAADAEGNPSGVESAMAELVRVAGGGSGGPARHRPVGPGDLSLVHPETVALYRSLSRHRGAVGPPPGTL